MITNDKETYVGMTNRTNKANKTYYAMYKRVLTKKEVSRNTKVLTCVHPICTYNASTRAE